MTSFSASRSQSSSRPCSIQLRVNASRGKHAQVPSGKLIAQASMSRVTVAPGWAVNRRWVCGSMSHPVAHHRRWRNSQPGRSGGSGTVEDEGRRRHGALSESAALEMLAQDSPGRSLCVCLNPRAGAKETCRWQALIRSVRPRDPSVRRTLAHRPQSPLPVRAGTRFHRGPAAYSYGRRHQWESSCRFDREL